MQCTIQDYCSRFVWLCLVGLLAPYWEMHSGKGRCKLRTHTGRPRNRRRDQKPWSEWLISCCLRWNGDVQKVAFGHFKLYQDILQWTSGVNIGTRKKRWVLDEGSEWSYCDHVTVLAVPGVKYVVPQAMKQHFSDKYINKIIYSGCQLIQAPVMALFVTSRTSCKTRNTLNIDSGEN